MRILFKSVIYLPVILSLAACSSTAQPPTEHIKENLPTEAIAETLISNNTEILTSNSTETPTLNSTETPTSNNLETPISEPTDSTNGGMENMDITNLPQVEFGYANADGSKIIVLYDHKFKDNSLFTYFKYAVGENGKVYEIEYDTYQERGAEDSGRQTARNFANQQGCVYKFMHMNAIQNQTYMLLTQGINDEGIFFLENKDAILAAYSRELMEKCAILANRKVKNSWLLSEYREGYRVSVIEFESIGKELLAWLVLDSDDSIMYCEMPAKLSEDGYTGWQYGDCGELTGNFDNIIYTIDIICTIQKQQEIIVYLSWYDEEGETISEIVFSPDKTPTKKTVNGRYTVYY